MENDQLIRVKFVNRGQVGSAPAQWLRQFPGQIPVWGKCEFIFDPNEQNYDWFVAENDLSAPAGQGQKGAIEQLACSPDHTLFITREPSSVSTYGQPFLDQFRYVLTGHEDWALKHRGKIHSQPALRWYYGDTGSNGGIDMRDYDMIAQNPPLNKTKEISTVCSAKAQRHTMHYQRVKFVEYLTENLPEIERFGHGFRAIVDKADALDAYKYHIAIENHICPHWWTEKLSDSFLGMTLPFYHGAPNAAEYFPADSFIPIDIFDFAGSLKIIQDAIASGEYEKRLGAIKEARKRVLEDYSTFAVVSKIIEERYDSAAKPSVGTVIKGKHALRTNPRIAVSIALEKTYIRVKTVLNKFDSRSI